MTAPSPSSPQEPFQTDPIEKLPKEADSQNNLAKEIEQFQAELERKRKAMFNDIEEKLKKKCVGKKSKKR